MIASRRTCLGLVAIAALFPASHANAEFVYNNLAASGPAESVFGERGDHVAQQFLIGNNTTVESATLRLLRDGSPSGRIDVQIWDDDGTGFPGSEVGTLGSIEDFSLLPQGSFTNLSFDNSVSGLTPGARYYVVLSFLEANISFLNEISWRTVATSSGTFGAARSMGRGPSTGGEWVVIADLFGTQAVNYFQMSVNAVPEPSTALLLALASTALVGCLRVSRQ